MIAPRASIILSAALLGGCATADPLEGQRTVFNNPYVPPEMDRRAIGPQCDVDIGRDATCLGGPLIYPGRGRTAVLSNGERVRLTRAQAQLLRERAALREARRNEPPPPPPLKPVLPTAASGGETP